MPAGVECFSHPRLSVTKSSAHDFMIYQRAKQLCSANIAKFLERWVVEMNRRLA